MKNIVTLSNFGVYLFVKEDFFLWKMKQKTEKVYLIKADNNCYTYWWIVIFF